MENETFWPTMARWSTVMSLAMIALGMAMIMAGLGLTLRDGTGLLAPERVDDRVQPSPDPAVRVVLEDFAITTDAHTITTGASLTVVNRGWVVHNIQVRGTELRTGNLQPGSDTTLDLSGLPTGTWQLMCVIPEHAAAGMARRVTIVDG